MGANQFMIGPHFFSIVFLSMTNSWIIVIIINQI